MMQNSTAVITGATSGIGAAYAKKFAEKGYDLIITGRRQEKIEALANEVRNSQNVQVEVVLAELSEKEGVHKVIEKMQGKKVDILVNNAGFGDKNLFQDCHLDVAMQMAKVNVLAPMELIRTVLPGMIERKCGTIINISSSSVYLVVSKNSVYSGVKAFLKTFTEALHMDLMGTNVKVMTVCPGLTHTDFHEKMGIDKSKQTDRGLLSWMSCEEVVNSSLKDLEKGKVICIPGMKNKLLIRLLNLLPKKIYDKMMDSFRKK